MERGLQNLALFNFQSLFLYKKILTCPHGLTPGGVWGSARHFLVYSIVIEPFRAKSFPIIKDLVVDRSAFDRIQHSGGYISINTSGNTQDANTTPIKKEDADNAFDAATCIGCGACVATCKNASAMLYVSAKVSQFSYLPQGKVEAKERVLNMVKQMDDEGFGNCTNTGACEVECPKGISIKNIARMNREFYKAKI